MTRPVDRPAAATPAHDGEDLSLRASNADRDRAAHVIHRAAGAGMLTLGEAEERLAAVYAARFRHELRPLVSDLPVEDAPPELRVQTPVTSVPDALRRLPAAAGAVAATAVTALARHRILAALLVLFVVAVMGSMVMGLAGEVFAGEHHSAEMMER